MKETFEQPRLFEDTNTRMGDVIDQFHTRLDEALYRLREEPEGHSFRDVAHEELREAFNYAQEKGMSPGEFLAVCEWVEENPWKNEDGSTYIETDEGRHAYFGTPSIVIGPGQLPPGDRSVQFLKSVATV